MKRQVNNGRWQWASGWILTKSYLTKLHWYHAYIPVDILFFFLTFQHMSDPWYALYPSLFSLVLLGRDLCPCIGYSFLTGKCPVGQFEMAWWPIDGTNVCVVACLFGARTTPYLARKFFLGPCVIRPDSTRKVDTGPSLISRNSIILRFPCGYEKNMRAPWDNWQPMIYLYYTHVYRTKRLIITLYRIDPG